MASIVDGLFSGRSGISSHGTAIAVLADNIANSNTVGFKQSRADFADLLAGGGGAVTAGSGSAVINTQEILTQGTFEFTGRGLDLGIDGNGYFALQDPAGGGNFYSRAGNFSVDKSGNLLNQNGYKVMGFPANGAGGLQGLNVNAVSQDSVRTANVTVGGNLDASAPLSGPIPGAGSTFAQLSNAAQFSTFVDVRDSLGAAHTVTTYFFHTAANTWEARSYVDGGDVTGGTPGVPTQLGTATIGFNSDGTRTAIPADFDYQATPAWDNGSAALPVDFLYDPFTQFSTASAISSITQDGTGAGSVTGFTVEKDGSLFATLNNGQTTIIGRIGLATFSNAEGLERIGGSLYRESNTSGEPIVGSPGSGSFGSIEAGALELSTSDMASDFIKLISYQRGFQGSSRIITNINDLLNEILNLA